MDEPPPAYQDVSAEAARALPRAPTNNPEAAAFMSALHPSERRPSLWSVHCESSERLLYVTGDLVFASHTVAASYAAWRVRVRLQTAPVEVFHDLRELAADLDRRIVELSARVSRLHTRRFETETAIAEARNAAVLLEYAQRSQSEQ